MEVAEIRGAAWDRHAGRGGIGAGEEGRADLVGGWGEGEIGGAEVEVWEAGVDCRWWVCVWLD